MIKHSDDNYNEAAVVKGRNLVGTLSPEVFRSSVPGQLSVKLAELLTRIP